MRHRQGVYWGNYEWIYVTRFFLTLRLAFFFLGKLLVFSMNNLAVGLEAL